MKSSSISAVSEETAGPVLLIANTSWYLYNFRQGTIRTLQEEGHSVVCLAPPDSFSDRLESELGAAYIPLNIAGSNRGLWREGLSLLAVFRALRELRPAFVFNFTIKANVYAGIVCRLLGVPYANNVTGLGTAFLYDTFMNRLVRRLYLWANGGAAHVFFQNPEDRALFVSSGFPESVPVTLLPGSGVDLDHFSAEPMPEGPLRFVMIARLLGDKGVREYVEAARLVKREAPDCGFDLVGPVGVANDSAIPEDEIRAWQAEGVVRWQGETDDVRQWLSSSHVFVLPSYYPEGRPRAVLEAAASGRPAVVTDMPGCRDAIASGQTGWLVPPRDAQALADVMLDLARGPRDRIEEAGVAARRLAEERFSEQVVVDAYLSCLKEYVGE